MFYKTYSGVLNSYLREQISKAIISLENNIPILIIGETGTGKSSLAQFLYSQICEEKQPFIRVSCGSLDPQLAESTLFGHAKGAYTGASGKRQGAFWAAHNGVLFLDELGALSEDVQVKLLTVLENGNNGKIEIKPLGQDESVWVETKIILATNANLEAMVGQGKFRQDLLSRIDCFVIEIPPLRERMVDILPLIRYFLTLKKVAGITRIHPVALEKLEKHEYRRGNIRELFHILRRASINAAYAKREMILVEDLQLTQFIDDSNKDKDSQESISSLSNNDPVVYVELCSIIINMIRLGMDFDRVTNRIWEIINNIGKRNLAGNKLDFILVGQVKDIIVRLSDRSIAELIVRLKQCLENLESVYQQHNKEILLFLDESQIKSQKNTKEDLSGEDDDLHDGFLVEEGPIKSDKKPEKQTRKKFPIGDKVILDRVKLENDSDFFIAVMREFHGSPLKASKHIVLEHQTISGKKIITNPATVKVTLSKVISQLGIKSKMEEMREEYYLDLVSNPKEIEKIKKVGFMPYCCDHSLSPREFGTFIRKNNIKEVIEILKR